MELFKIRTSSSLRSFLIFSGIEQKHKKQALPYNLYKFCRKQVANVIGLPTIFKLGQIKGSIFENLWFPFLRLAGEKCVGVEWNFELEILSLFIEFANTRSDKRVEKLEWKLLIKKISLAHPPPLLPFLARGWNLKKNGNRMPKISLRKSWFRKGISRVVIGQNFLKIGQISAAIERFLYLMNYFAYGPNSYLLLLLRAYSNLASSLILNDWISCSRDEIWGRTRSNHRHHHHHHHLFDSSQRIYRLVYTPL